MIKKEITNSEEWETLKSEVMNEQELIVFKYSPRCTVSFTAQNILKDWLKSLSEDFKPAVVIVNVITGREASEKITDDTGIRHESPQVIWISRNGNVKWHASHFEITGKKLSAQLNTQ